MSVFNHGFLCLSLFVTCINIHSVPCEGYGNTLTAQENASSGFTDTVNNKIYHLWKANDIHRKLIGVDDRYKAYNRQVTRQYDFVSPPYITSVPQVGLNRIPLSKFLVSPNSHKNAFNDNEIMNIGEPKNRFKIGNESDLYDKSRDTNYLCLSDESCNQLLENSVCRPMKNPSDFANFRICKCVRNLVLIDDECVSADGLNFCSSHKDCEAIEKARCTYLMTTVDTMICKCPSNYIMDNFRCLINVETGGSCESSRQCLSGVPCLMNICRPYCPYGYSRRNDSCVRDLPDIDPRYNGRPTMSNTAILVGIVGGVLFLIIMVLSMVAIILRSRMSDSLRRTPSPTGPYSSSIENSGQTVRSSSLISDVPPSYDEVMTSSTATLTTNVHEQSEDHLPSYKSWEQDYYNRPRIPNH